MNPRHQPQRIYAGQNGVYDAVYSEDAAEWFIRFCPYSSVNDIDILGIVPNNVEYSTTSYNSPYAARLAWERGQVTYQTLAQIRSVA